MGILGWAIASGVLLAVGGCQTPHAGGWDQATETDRSTQERSATPPATHTAKVPGPAPLTAGLAPAPLPFAAPVVIDPARPGAFACIADPQALTASIAVYRRVKDEAARQGIAVHLGGFVIIRAEPARSLSEPPPLLCRSTEAGGLLRAPLQALTLLKADVEVIDLIAGADVVRGSQALQGSGRQMRAVLDQDGAIVAVALLR